MKKNAFTMLELILVIVIIGIIAANAIPRLDRDTKQEASDKVLSAIRYTQHLALVDDKQSFDKPEWQRAFWQIKFDTCNDGGLTFRIGSNDDLSDGTEFTKEESAMDPSNGRHIYGTNSNCDTANPNVLLGKKYSVKSISGSGGCDDKQYIGFDHFGRPQIGFSTSDKPNESSYMTDECKFTFTMSDNSTFDIVIKPETGYAYIDGQPNS